MCLRVWGLIIRGGSRACERDGIAVEALSSIEGLLGPKVRWESVGGGIPLLQGGVKIL